MNKLIHLLHSLIVMINRKMSETDSDSTDTNDNNMSLFYNHYLGSSREPAGDEDNDLEVISSSESHSYGDSTSSIGEVRFLTLIVCLFLLILFY